MNTAEPIRDSLELTRFKEYYRSVNPNTRNYLLIIMGLNTALRISDVLKLKWKDVYDFKNKKYKRYIYINEQKTKKSTQIFINKNIREALSAHMVQLKSNKMSCEAEEYLFYSRKGEKAIGRMQADRIVKEAAESAKITGVISCHSMRKTFGYCAWKQGVSPALLVSIYNHSSYKVTKHYLGIEQDDKDKVYKNIKI